MFLAAMPRLSGIAYSTAPRLGTLRERTVKEGREREGNGRSGRDEKGREEERKEGSWGE